VNPPAPPGGRGGGGTAPGANPNQAFLDAIRSAEDLQRKTDRVFDTINQKTQPQLANQFELAKNELEDILVLLRRSSQDRDPLRLQEGLDRLQTVRARFQGNLGQSLIGQTAGSSQRSELVSELRELERLNRQKDQIRSTLAQSALQGLPFAEKMDLRAVNSQIRTTQVELDGLIRGFNGTEQSLEQVIQKFLELNKVEDISAELRDRLQQVYSRPLPDAFETLRNTRQELEVGLRSTGRSFNTLTNNAYQLGQAIEDFSVGYSLNGFAGGIRGAANNVAFLLNDMSRLESVQAKLGPNWAKQLPLIAGIGSALAITVLPALIDWLESLNDIETKFEDISRRIKSDFDEVEFNVKLEGDERSFSRSIRRTEELKDAIEALRDASDELNDKQLDLQSTFSGFSESSTVGESVTQLTELQKLMEEAAKRQALSIEGQKQVIKDLSEDPFVVLSGAANQKGFEENIKAAEEVRKAYDDISKSAAEINGNLEEQVKLGTQGVFDSEKMKSIVDAFDSISERSKEIASQDLADPKAAENLVKTLDAMRNIVDTFRKAFAEIDSANRKIASGLEIAKQKADEFAVEQVLITQVVKGNVNEGVLFAFETLKRVNQQAADIEQARNDNLRFARRFGTDPDLINENADTLKEGVRIAEINTLLLREKAIREERDSAQKQLDERDGQSQLTTLEKISQELIQAQFSVPDDSEEELIKRIEDLTEQLRIIGVTIKSVDEGMSNTVSPGGPGAFSFPMDINWSRISELSRLIGISEPTGNKKGSILDSIGNPLSGVNFQQALELAKIMSIAKQSYSDPSSITMDQISDVAKSVGSVILEEIKKRRNNDRREDPQQSGLDWKKIAQYAEMAKPVIAGPGSVRWDQMSEYAKIGSSSEVFKNVRDAVYSGVQDAMSGTQKQVVDELKGVNDGVRKINNGAQ
jgi:hypothetical protein